MSDNNDKQKTKVLIITRSSEYVENDVAKKGREKYGNSILKEWGEKNALPYSKDKTNLKRFLKVVDEVNTWDVDNYDSQAAEIYGIGRVDLDICMGDDLAYKEYIIKEILNKKPVLTEEERGERCYVRFEHEEYEIVLILWDKLLGHDGQERGMKEKVEPFGLFVEKICEDCGVCASERNILYVHDYQLLGDKKDDIVLDKENEIYPDNYSGQTYYSKLKDLFVHVAVFGHNSYGIFPNNILKFNFRTPVYALIGKKEKETTSFSDLRDSADDIVNNYK